MSGFGDTDGRRSGDDFDDGIEQGADTPAEETPAEETLAFDQDGESLPWLESDEDYDEDQGVDTRRIMVFVATGLALLGILVGLIWWLSHRGPDAELVADGSTVAAPEGPYKVKPEEPGGKVFAGTGDESFAVGEGKTPDGRIAPASGAQPKPEARPSLAVSQGAEAKNGANASAGAVGVQVGAYSSRAGAETGWGRLVATHEVLKGYSHRVIEGTADIGTVFRLQAVVGDEAGANQLCATLRSQGAACQVKR